MACARRIKLPGAIYQVTKVISKPIAGTSSLGPLSLSPADVYVRAAWLKIVCVPSNRATLNDRKINPGVIPVRRDDAPASSIGNDRQA